MVRVARHKYTSKDGVEYDSREEYLYHLLLLSDKNVSCIHRQVRLNILPPIYMLVPRQLKTKVRIDKRLMVSGHNYTSDFIFFEGDKIVVCDVKSEYTRSLREYSITKKGVIEKIVTHNKKRHGWAAHVIFREAIHLRKNEWRIIDYPPDGAAYCLIPFS